MDKLNGCMLVYAEGMGHKFGCLPANNPSSECRFHSSEGQFPVMPFMPCRHTTGEHKCSHRKAQEDVMLLMKNTVPS